jgi:hypothetical protein
MRSALAFALLHASTAAAAAQDRPTWNAGLRGSLAFNSSITAKDASMTPPITAKADLSTGGGASVFYGLSLPSGFDAELEFIYRYMPLGDGVVNGVSAKLGAMPRCSRRWSMSIGPSLRILPIKP